MRAVGAALAVVILVWTFRDTQPHRVAELLGRVGAAGVVLLLLPQLLSLAVESFGWRMAFRAMGHRLPYLGLFRARIASEALAQTLPLGTLVCESMKPLLLARTCGADLSTSLAGMAARKWLLVGSQTLYLGGFCLLSWPLLTRISPDVLGGAGLPWLLGAMTLLWLLLALAGYGMLARGRVAERLYTWLCSWPWPWLKLRLQSSRYKFSNTDGQLQSFFASTLKSPLPLLPFLGGWLLEACETFLILWLLGANLSWTTVGAMEVSASFLRNVAFVVPAGLGVQDLSYLTFLRALHVPDALNVAAAFLLLKRSKECFWAACGYVVLALELRESALPKRLEPTQSC